MGEDWGSGERRHHSCTYKKALPRHTVSHLSHIHMFFFLFFLKQTTLGMMNPPASTFVRPVVSLCLGLKKQIRNNKKQNMRTVR